MRKAKPLFKIFLSVWVVYNIFTMLLMPNISSYFGRLSSKYITPYANTVGLNASWNFFSPDPAHTMYLRYFVHFLDEEGIETQETIEGFFPAEKNQGISNSTRKRELYAMRFMVIDPQRLKSMMGPWFCKQYEGASSIDMEHVVETVPPLDQAVVLRREDVKDLSQELQYVNVTYNCTGERDEVAQ